MDKETIQRTIETNLIEYLIKTSGVYYVPVAISARHVHLSKADIERLFGKGYELKRIRDLRQPKQFACEETVTVTGPKGAIEKVRVLGPAREETQVELSMTDSIKLGITPEVRMSGDLKETPGGKISGPCGEVALSKGYIVAARHLHLSKTEAECFGLKNGNVVSVKTKGQRSIVFENVIVRAGDGHALEMHIDTDEANAAGMHACQLCELIK
jgi:putative phosphotransacetylase